MSVNVIDVRRIRLKSSDLPPRLRFRTPPLEPRPFRLDYLKSESRIPMDRARSITSGSSGCTPIRAGPSANVSIARAGSALSGGARARIQTLGTRVDPL